MNHVFPTKSGISLSERSGLMGQQPVLVWFTGLSGSGKSTMASLLERYLFEQGFKAFLLDGDNLRSGINKDLGFSESDRRENIRRAGEIAKIMVEAGLIVLAAFISPHTSERETIRNSIGASRFVEVYVNCPLDICEERDVKGLYGKARSGLIPQFTGISSPYEPPVNPDIEIRTAEQTIEESFGQIVNSLLPLITL